MPLKGKRVLVMLTGGIACYKVPNLVRLLVKQKAEVRVVMTRNASRFITPLTLEAVSRHPVASDMVPDDQFVATRHIELATWADLVIIAPATANIIGKAAAGISDDLVSTIICATDRTVLLAPAMNPNMWTNRVTRRNFEFLTSQMHWRSIGPEEGEMAEDEWGIGRMSEPEDIFKAAAKILKSSGKGADRVQTGPSRPKKKALEGKRFIITAGPCREPLDPVRYISNRSSGKMGYALAAVAHRLGADTTLITGPTNLDLPTGPSVVKVETTAQMYRAVSSRFRRTDCLIMAAAPADFEPVRLVKHKLKKHNAAMSLEMKPTVDILASLATRKRKGQIVIGFALETENGIASARDKMKSKNLDLILLNNPTESGAGFDYDTNRVTVIRPRKKPDRWSLLSKSELAERLLLELVVPLM